MKKILSVVLGLAIILIACNNIGSTSGTPKDILDQFFTALSRKDFVTARKYATQESEMMFNMMEMGMKMAPDSVKNKTFGDKSRLEYGDATITGDNATVPVKDKVSGERTTFNLKKEAGSWKVAFDLTSMMQMGQNKMKEKGMTEPQINEMMNKMKGALESNPELKKLMKDSVQ